MDYIELVRRWAPTLVTQAVHPAPDDPDLNDPDEATEPDEPTESPAPVRTGVMVAFFLDPDAAEELALDDGEDPDQLHLTLAYLGTVGEDLDSGDEARLVATVATWAAGVPPVAASIAGVGFFTASDPTVTYASIDAPALPAIRQSLVDALSEAGFGVNSEHGYTPHVTLDYTDRRDTDVIPRDLLFDTVTLAFAGQQTTFPLKAPTAQTAGLVVTDRPDGPAPEVTAPEISRTFVADVNGRTLITAPATTIAAYKDLTLDDITDTHMLWMHGKFVGAEVPNRNGALWSAGDLQLSAGSVTNGPLNWLHESRHVIGTLAKSAYVDGKTATERSSATIQPHITATAAIWRWIYPDEAYVVQQASDLDQLWYSMECISKEVACAGPTGCGATSTYAAYLAGGACDHVTQRASVRQFINPVFLGGAVIVPPSRPGWAEADASVMSKAALMAEAAFEQAGHPDVPASDWEQLMAQVLRFGAR